MIVVIAMMKMPLNFNMIFLLGNDLSLKKNKLNNNRDEWMNEK